MNGPGRHRILSRVARPAASQGLLLAALLAGGCSLAARQHPCWAYAKHQFGGTVPPAVVRLLAHDKGARREVARHRAPTGYYWRQVRREGVDLREIHTVLADHELAACPGIPAGRRHAADTAQP